MITWRGSTPNQHPKKPNGFWNEKNSFHSADGLASFFWRSSIAQKSLLQWSQTSNVGWRNSWKFQLWAFSPQQAGVARHFWTQSSYNGLASRHRQKIFKRWGSQPVTWKKSTFPKSFYFISAEGKNVKKLFGKNIQDKLICLKHSLKCWSLKSLTISSTIYPKAQPSPSSVRTCTCLHNGAGHRS